MFEFDGSKFTLEYMLKSNSHDDAFCTWARSAPIGDNFCGCVRVSDEADAMTAKIDMHPILTQVLVECGWTAYSGPAIALKSFDTAVGVKEAVAWLSKGDEYNRTLSGEFQSEGRNVLESSCVLIPLGADAETVRLLVQQFANQVDTAVAESYAARLYMSAR